MSIDLPFDVSGSMVSLLLLVVLAVGLLGLWLYVSGLEQQRMLASRSALDEVERRSNTPLARLDARLRRTQFGRNVERRILASGRQIRVATFLLMLAAAVLATIFIVWSVLAPFLGFVAALGVVWVFFRYLRRHETRRREEFVNQLPEIARVLSNATNAGLALRTAVEMAAEELDEPARDELRLTSAALKLGQPVEEALRELGERLPSRELSVLVSTLVVSSRAGGSLVTALRNIAQTLDQRKEVRREVRTTLAQSVYTSYMVAAIGVGALFLANAMNPGVIEDMTHSAIGLAVLGASGALFVGGFFAITRMTKVDM
jgi:tight adherence protein B